MHHSMSNYSGVTLCFMICTHALNLSYSEKLPEFLTGIKLVNFWSAVRFSNHCATTQMVTKDYIYVLFRSPSAFMQYNAQSISLAISRWRVRFPSGIQKVFLSRIVWQRAYISHITTKLPHLISCCDGNGNFNSGLCLSVSLYISNNCYIYSWTEELRDDIRRFFMLNGEWHVWVNKIQSLVECDECIFLSNGKTVVNITLPIFW